MSKHIVIDARQFSTSSGRYVRELLSGLEKLDKENQYSILLLPEDIESYKPTNPNFTSVSAPFTQFSLSEQIGLLTFIYKLKPDLVHFAFAQQPMFYLKNKITTIHDLTALNYNSSEIPKPLYLYLRFFYRALIKSATRRSKYILTPSEFTKQELINLTNQPEDKIIVTYEAAGNKAPSESKPKFAEHIDQYNYIMYTGRPVLHKNLINLVKAFEKLHTNKPNLKLVLVGKLEKHYHKIQKYIEKNKIQNVIFTGFIPDSELNWLYKHCAAYVFPSLSEGFGLPGLEAMVQGAPVVSSNATCLPEIYGDAALYFNPNDPEDIALKIERVLGDNTYRKQLIAKGAKQVKKYSWEKTAKQTLAVYNKALGK